MSTDNVSWQERGNEVLVGNYARYPVTFVKGDGCRLVDAEGKEYLDFLAGIAVCSLGHCHPKVTEAICRQAESLVHVSNLYYTQPQTELAELLTANSFADKVFFANSGAEVNEAAIKLARIYSAEGKHEILSLSGSFHGRTLASVAATGQPKFHEGFEPMPVGFRSATFGDLDGLAAMITPKTCAIMCEPLQGESGVRPLDREYLQGIRKLCDDHDLLLIFDEVQSGMGRTGSLFAYQQLDVVPDIMTAAKALGNGLPIGAMLTTDKIAKTLIPGSHGSTFGGNPVASAAAVAVMKTMLEEDFFDEVTEKGVYFTAQLEKIAGKYPKLATSARGMGLLLGLVLTTEGISVGADIVNSLFKKGFLINFAGGAVLRFAPPLVVSVAEINELIAALDETLAEFA